MKEIERLLGEVILPALGCSAPNPALSQCVWDVLCNYPYTTRYKLYGRWLRQYRSISYLQIAKAKAFKEAKAAFK